MTALAGQPLIAHCAARLRRQVEFLIINAGGDPVRFAGLDAAIVCDPDPQAFAGPLAGIDAAMGFARAQGATSLATAPCDAPFLPLDLVARLRQAMDAAGAPAAVARYAGELEPMFSLWRVEMNSRIAAALAQGEASPRKLLARSGAAIVDFAAPEGESPFANINDPESLATAEARLATGR
jgi:molybdopterin-guanine dinucleotide biosynthesis protein A